MPIATLPNAPFARKPVWRKNRHPSSDMHASDGKSYECIWLEDSLTILSDGNVTCGLDDPHAARSFGNIHERSLAEIYANPEIERLRQRLKEGARCRNCHLYIEAPRDRTLPDRSSHPRVLVVEPTIKCNLRCPNTACEPNNSRTVRTREADMLDLAAFQKIIDQAGPYLHDLYFFNYGDPFVNPEAEDMLLYARRASDDLQIISSTNGIPLKSERRAAKTGAAAVNHLTFTISGVNQSSYERYHVNGKVENALQGLANYCAVRPAPAQGGRATVTWRYLLFRWNDSDGELARAVELAAAYGVDQLSFYLTNLPENASSYRLAPGTPLFHKYAQYIDAAHGYHVHLPDTDGFYDREMHPQLGAIRWTSWIARLQVATCDGWARISIASGHPGVDIQFCYLSLDDEVYKIPLSSTGWTHVTLKAGEAVDLGIVAGNPWFPIDQIDSNDGRCLGVLISVDEACHPGDDDACWIWVCNLPKPSSAERDLVVESLAGRQSLIDHATSGRMLP